MWIELLWCRLGHWPELTSFFFFSFGVFTLITKKAPLFSWLSFSTLSRKEKDHQLLFSTGHAALTYSHPRRAMTTLCPSDVHKRKCSVRFPTLKVAQYAHPIPFFSFYFYRIMRNGLEKDENTVWSSVLLELSF